MTIGLLLQYFISKLIKQSIGKTVIHPTNNVYDVNDMLCMSMKFAEP